MKAMQSGRQQEVGDSSYLNPDYYAHGKVFLGGYAHSVEKAKKIAPEKTHNILMRDSSKYAIQYAQDNNLFS